MAAMSAFSSTPFFGSPPPAPRGATFPKSWGIGTTSTNVSPAGAARAIKAHQASSGAQKIRPSVDWGLSRGPEHQDPRRLRRLGQPAAFQAEPRQPLRRRRAAGPARGLAGRSALADKGYDSDAVAELAGVGGLATAKWSLWSCRGGKSWQRVGNRLQWRRLGLPRKDVSPILDAMKSSARPAAFWTGRFA